MILKIARKTGGKLTSHLLSAHGGEIFIHTLHISRSCLEDLPAVLESGGGKLSEYRINEYSALIQGLKIIPLKPMPERHPDRNLARLRAKLSKNTKHFPLISGTTIVYNVRQVQIDFNFFSKVQIPKIHFFPLFNSFWNQCCRWSQKKN